jgi:hypothetical protein
MLAYEGRIKTQIFFPLQYIHFNLFKQNFAVVRGYSHNKWVTCHHSMALPQVADGGNDFQLRRITANRLMLESKSGQPPRSNAPLSVLREKLTIPRC